MTSRSTARSILRSTRSAAGLALGYALALSGIACSSYGDPPGALAELDPPGATHGELKVYAATFEDGRKETHYALRDVAGEERPLLFREPPAVSPGTVIRVWGSALQGDALEVTSWEIVPRDRPEIASQSEPLINGPVLPSRNMCVFMVDIGAPFGRLTNDVIDQSFFTGTKSVDAFYRENSFGKTGLDGKVYGPFPFTMTTCNTQGMATAMKAMIAPTTCDQYAYVFGQSNLCAWGGLGAVGSPTTPARDTWYNGSVSCVVAVQEPGHNFGMAHSSSMACGPTTALTTFAADPTTSCRHSEYGDRFDPMGGACRHMNVWQKQYERWFGGCNAVTVNSSGTYNLLPTELACDGLQALQIPLPTPKTFARPAGGGSSAGTDTLTHYYLEYRVSAGFDTGMAPTVLLHVGTAPPSQTATRGGGKHTWLLDTHPAGTGAFNDAGFKAGETFTDPGGALTITVVSMDADKAVVRVEVPGGTGDPVCMDGTPFAAPGLTACGTAPPPPPDDGGVPPVVVVPRDAGVRDATVARETGAAPGRDAAPAGSPEAATVFEGGLREASSEPRPPTLPLTPDAAPVVVADAGTRTGGPVDGVEGGCSCRSAGGSGGTGSDAGKAVLGLALVVGASRRVRRRRAS